MAGIKRFNAFAERIRAMDAAHTSASLRAVTRVSSGVKIPKSIDTSGMMSPDSKAISRGYKAAAGVLGAPGIRTRYGVGSDQAISRGKRRMIIGGAAAGAYTMIAPPNPNSRYGRSGSGMSSGGTGMLNSRSIGGYA